MVPVHEWRVAGALLEKTDGLLLVRNVRQGGWEDWSTPGGVIDAEDESVLAGLTREVAEETGLRVSSWTGPVYEVRAHAIDMGWLMHCQVHLALAFEGELAVSDPDGIVVEAAWVPSCECAARLTPGARWVREPLEMWLSERWEPDSGRGFFYEVRGTSPRDLRVVRRD